MIRDIKKCIEEKVRLIGNNFDPSLVWKNEMMLIQETEWEYFPEFKCTYYSDNQVDGMMEFKVRFSFENQYLDYIDLNADIQVIL